MACIDHHPTSENMKYHFHRSRVACSTSYMIYELMQEVGYQVSTEEAKMIVASMMVDTVSFRSAKTVKEEAEKARELAKQYGFDYKEDKMVYLVVFEVFLIFVCIFAAKKMLANQTVLAKFVVIGEDDANTIKEMEMIARKIMLRGRVQNSDRFYGYGVNVKDKDGKIEKIVIDSRATRISWHFKDGWRKTNFAFTEKEAVKELAFELWLFAFLIQIIIGTIVFPM